MHKQALQKAIAAVRPGVRYREVGDIISQHVGQHKYQVASCMSRMQIFLSWDVAGLAMLFVA